MPLIITQVKQCPRKKYFTAVPKVGRSTAHLKIRKKARAEKERVSGTDAKGHIVGTSRATLKILVFVLRTITKEFK